jgi:hypothetical protein
MKVSGVTRSAMLLIMGLAAAVVFTPRSRLVLAASHDLLTYNGNNKGLGAFSCHASNYETCPGAECTCLSSTGSASGDFTGTGFATLDIIVTDDSSAMCQDFNAAMFIIGPKDLEEVDFSGTACDDLDSYSGNYTIATSQAGHSGSGTFSGTRSKKQKFAFSFH